MAKKKAVKKTELVPAEVIDNDVVGNNVSIDMDDVLSIAISRAEMMMQERVNQFNKEAKETASQAEKLEQEIINDCTEATKTKYGEAIDAAKNGFKTLSGRTVNESIEDVAVGELHEKSAQSRSGKSSLVQKGKFEVSIVLFEGKRKNGEDAYYGYRNQNVILETAKTDPLPAGVAAKVKECLALQNASTNAKAEALTWRKKLANIGKLERQYRGRLAEQKLSKTEEGRNIVQALTEGVENDILALPPA